MTTRENIVLVLGCGVQGADLVRWLTAKGPFSHIIAADLNLSVAQVLAQKCGLRKVEAIQVDVNDREATVRLMQRAGVVINCTGPFFRLGRATVEAALEARTPYVDINDDTSSIEELLNDAGLDRRAVAQGQVVLIGTGTSPGLTSMLARLGADQLEKVESVLVGLAAAIAWRSPGIFAHFVHSLARPARVYRQGMFLEVAPFSESQELRFLGVQGPVHCYTAGLPEAVMLPRVLRGVQGVTTVMGRIPNATMEMLRDMYRYGLMTTEPIPVGQSSIAPADFLAAYLASDPADRVFGFSRTQQLSARLVQVTGVRDGRRVRLTYRHTSRSITAAVTALTVIEVARGHVPRCGVLTPEELDPRPILEAFQKEGGSFQAMEETLR